MSCSWALEGGRVPRRILVLRSVSKKELSRRHLQKHAFSESTTPFACALPTRFGRGKIIEILAKERGRLGWEKLGPPQKIGTRPHQQNRPAQTENTESPVFLWFNSVETRCIVKGEAQKSPLFWRFSGVFDLLRIACSLGIPKENL